MTQQPTTATEADASIGSVLQEEIVMLRTMNQQAHTWFEECQSVADRLRYLATISMSCTRLATLLKVERLLSGGDDEYPSIAAELSAALKELDGDQ
jgi:hypothetical protein